MQIQSRVFKHATGLFMALVYLCIFSASSFAVEASHSSPENIWHGKPAKYVFVFIGDGLGLQQISSAEAYLAAEEGVSRPGIKKLHFSNFPAQGLSTTYSANSFITDSAPAATALATGYKTDNGVIGLDPSKTKSFTTMAELARDKGMKIGIISTVSLNHATPAAYYAHIPSRNSYYEIGLQLIASRFDYFAGGGLHKAEAPDASGKSRKSLYTVAEESCYLVLRDKDSILKLQETDKPVIAVNPILDADSAMPYAIDGGPESVSLKEFVSKGIDVLDNPDGFFMMVEGGKIDWACHANDAGTSIHDILAFNDAVQVAIDFAAKHSDETAIIVTGDHETGGMSLGFAGTEYASFFEKIGHQKISYLEFDAKIAELRKQKGSRATVADIKDTVNDFFGLSFPSEMQYKSLAEQAKKDPSARQKLGMALTMAEQEQIAQALSLSMEGSRISAPDTQEFLLYGGYEPLSIQITHILNNKAGIGWTSYAHTAIPVPVFAIGVGSELYRGYYDNTDIAWKTMSLMGLAPQKPSAYVAGKNSEVHTASWQPVAAQAAAAQAKDHYAASPATAEHSM